MWVYNNLNPKIKKKLKNNKEKLIWVIINELYQTINLELENPDEIYIDKFAVEY